MLDSLSRRKFLQAGAIAAGEISGRFNQAELGGTFQFTGFMARKSRNSKSLVFHIIDFEKTIQPIS